MAYYIKPVDRDCLPPGKDWALVDGPDGDMYFVLHRDVDRINLSDDAAQLLLQKIGQHVGLLEAS